MTTEEFWEKYIHENILDIFDDTCDFFSKDLPEGFIENYDVDEVILETGGHHQTAKEFDKVLKFTELIQEKQPKLYGDNFQYFDDFLVDYYCYHGDKTKVEQAFINFMDQPIQGIDQYLISFKKLLFYQHTNLLEEAITKNFHEIANSEDLVGGAEHDLAHCKLYLTLEDSYKMDKGLLNKKKFSELLNGYFDFDDDFLPSLEQGLFKAEFDHEQLTKAFMRDRNNCFGVLQGHFLKYMVDKGFTFYLSGKLWNDVLGFLNENNKPKNLKPDAYFKVKRDKFEKYLISIAGDIFTDNKAEMMALLWGSVYVYDFLFNINFIGQGTYDSFMHISRVLKGNIIGAFTPYLWNANFVHHWEKPDGITETEFIEEEKIFRKSIALKPQKFTELREEISEELVGIGELAPFIIEGGEESDKSRRNLSIFDKLSESFNNDELDDSFNKIDIKAKAKAHSVKNENITTYSEPMQAEQTPGRNDPCSCGSGKKYKKCCG